MPTSGHIVPKPNVLAIKIEVTQGGLGTTSKEAKFESG